MDESGTNMSEDKEGHKSQEKTLQKKQRGKNVMQIMKKSTKHSTRQLT